MQISEKKLKKYSYFSQGIIGYKLAQDNPYPTGTPEATAWDDGYRACLNPKFGDISNDPAEARWQCSG